MSDERAEEEKKKLFMRELITKDAFWSPSLPIKEPDNLNQTKKNEMLFDVTLLLEKPLANPIFWKIYWPIEIRYIYSDKFRS